MNRVRIFIGISLALSSGAFAQEMRAMRSASGENIRARLEGFEGDKVIIRREDWQRFEIPLDRFHPEEQARLKAEIEALKSTVTKINEAAGHPLVSLTPLDGTEAKSVADAMGLRPESSTRFGSSWRLYVRQSGQYRLFGAMPYSTALYSDKDGLITHISAVFANKGDFGSTAGSGEDHFGGGTASTSKTLTQAMKADEEAITRTLTEAIGPGATQRFGERATRRNVTRWDWNGYSFILSHEDGEYVGLSIMSTAAADGGGRSERISNRDIRERLLGSVQRDENGDVWISDIPMVDQGPKGYCVPATFERAMRMLGLDADMYLLAMIGESNAGGGTSVERLLGNVRSSVRSKGRRTADEDIRELRIRNIKRRIDEGVPVMWTMNSMDDFNKIANDNTRMRKDNSTPAEERMAKMREATVEAARAPAEDRGHLCMIIGYNETTQELAVSDSWGPNYALRWVPIETAQWVSKGRLFYILP